MPRMSFCRSPPSSSFSYASLISASLYQASQESPPLSPHTPPQEASDLLNGLYSAFPPPNCHSLRDQGALLAAVVLLPGVECGRP